jgi:GT2 family glycosyltransferase
MSSSLVSVIIPAYNRAYCLSRTLDSLLGQSYGRFEALIIDDGSTDGTEELVRSRYGGDSRIRYCYQTNQGVTVARNRGLDLAQGDFVAFLDSDDVWAEWKLEVQVAALERHPELRMVWTEMEAVDPDGQVISHAFLRQMYSSYQWFTLNDLFACRHPATEIVPHLSAVSGATLFTGDIFAPMVTGNLVHTSTVMFRRDQVGALRRFDERYRFAGEDYEFHLRTCREGPVGFLDVPSIQYQTGMPDRLTRPGMRVDIACGFLQVLLETLDREGDRIHLPKKLIERTLADAYGWAGWALLDAGRVREAREHLWKAVLHGERNTRLLGKCAVSFLPEGVAMGVLGAIRSTKHLTAGHSKGHSWSAN